MAEIREIIGNTTTTPDPQSDWDQTDATRADYIKNKPEILTKEEIVDLIGEHSSEGQIQSDWAQTDETQKDYIHNKPDIEAMVAENTTYTNSEPLIQNVGGILADNHPEGFDNVPISDLITELLYPYTKPSIGTLNLTPAAGIKQKNVGFDVTKASIVVTKKSKSIQSVTLYRGNIELQSKTDGVAAGGTFSFTLSDERLTGDTNTSYKVKVTEAGEGGKTYESSAVGYTFVYPFYYGVIGKDATVDSATILGFDKSIINKQNHSHSYKTNNERPVIAYPKDYGTLKSIVDPNNFTQEWTQSVVTVNDGETIPNIDYYVYVGGAATATNTAYKFNFS